MKDCMSETKRYALGIVCESIEADIYRYSKYSTTTLLEASSLVFELVIKSSLNQSHFTW